MPPFLISISGLLIFLLFKLYTKRQDEKKSSDFLSSFLKPKTNFIESTEPDDPKSFGYKNLWFAVKSNDKYEIAKVLEISVLGKSNWQNGIDQAYNNRIFITPDINGWTLIVGQGFLSLIDKDGIDTEICNKLSRKFGESQYFYTHRITEYHIWAKSINGKLTRYYSYLGEQGENIRIEGEPTEIEKGVNLVNTFSKEAENEKYMEDENLVFPNEGLVMEIAENWSINPTELEKYKDIKRELGLVCEVT